MTALASNWRRLFPLLLYNHWIGIQRSKISASSNKFVLFRPIGQPRLPTLPNWLRHFSVSFLKPLNRIQGNLTDSNISTSSTTFVFFGPIEKPIRPPWSLIGWDVFDILSETAEFNDNWQEARSKRPLPSLCFCGPIGKNKMVALASYWQRHFRLLLWNRWTGFNETW